MSTSGGILWVHRMDIMSASGGGVQDIGGYHEYIGDVQYIGGYHGGYHEYIGVFNRN